MVKEKISSGKRHREGFKKEREEEIIFITRDKIEGMKKANLSLLYDQAIDTIVDAMANSMTNLERMDYDINTVYVKSKCLKFYNTLTSNDVAGYEVDKFLDKIYQRVLDKDSMIIYRI